MHRTRNDEDREAERSTRSIEIINRQSRDEISRDEGESGAHELSSPIARGFAFKRKRGSVSDKALSVSRESRLTAFLVVRAQWDDEMRARA